MGSNPVFNKVVPPNANTFFLHVTGIVQDKTGYMWFSTKRGLFRYDGYQMISYKNDPLNPNSIITDELENICTDNAGNIWIATVGMGLLKFDPVSERFTSYRHSEKDTNSLVSDTIISMLYDKRGNLWLGTRASGLDRFDQRSGKFIHYKSDPGDSTTLSSDVVVKVYEDRQGTIWIGTGSVYDEFKDDPTVGGLNRMDDISGKFRRYKHDTADLHSLINNKIHAIYESSDGTFWVGTGGDGLHTMDRKTGVFNRLTYDPASPDKISRPRLLAENPDHITYIIEDSKGGMWIGTSDNGINYYDPLTRKGRHIITQGEYNEQTSWTAYSSRDGVLWISSIHGGLYRVNPSTSTIPLVKDNTGDVNDFYEDRDGTLWIASEHRGVLQYDRNNKLLKQFVNDPSNPSSLSHNTIGVLGADSYGNLWVGTMGGGLNQLPPDRKGFKRFHHDAKDTTSISNDIIFNIYEDSSRNLWITTFYGLNLMNRKNNTFRRFIFYPEDTVIFGKNIVSSIIEDTDSLYWVSSWQGAGVQLLNLKDGRFKTYLKGTSIIRVYKDKDGTIWAGGGEGLFYYRKNSDSFIRFTDPMGLTEIIDVKSFIEDNDKNLWVTSGNRLIKINPDRDLLSSYGNSSHINNMLKYGHTYRSRTGKLYFAAISGYYSFDPRELNKDARPSPIIITNIRSGNKILKADRNGSFEGRLTDLEKLELNYDQNAFSIDFETIDYTDPSANRHVYMLERYERTWNQAGFDRRAIYSNIEPGKYIFRMRAVNALGIWSEKKIEIEIIPAWWNQWWFRIAVITGIILLIYGILRWRVHEKFRIEMERTEREKQLSILQHRTAQLEMHALRAQMNPHFLFNSLNSINRFILQNNSEQASEYLTKFSRLMRLILQNSQSELIPLENELEALKLYLELEAVRFDHHFSYAINIDPDLDVLPVKVPPLIIQPYAENAIWHGLMHKEEKGNLLIELFAEGKFLVCRITDDGIGRKRSAELKSNTTTTHKSMGMKITADRIAIMKQKRSNEEHIHISDLVLPDGRPAGTRVEIKIPMNHD